MKKKLVVILSALLAPSLFFAMEPAAGPQQPSTNSNAPERALLDRYCVACHNQKTKNGLALDDLDVGRVGNHAEEWERVVRKIRAGMMPPSGAPRPEPAALEAMTVWLEN